MRRPGPRTAIISVLLFGLLIFGSVAYTWNTVSDVFQAVAPPSASQTIPFEVPNGATTADIADSLQQKGLIRNALAFRLWARVKGLDARLQAGVYHKLNTSMTIDSIVSELLNAQPDAIHVVIPEGWRLEQIAARFASSGLVKFNEQEFLNYTRHIDQFPDKNQYPMLRTAAGKSMEGFLFPASYEVPVSGDARAVVKAMLKAMVQNIQENHLDTLAQQHRMDLYQMLTVASIVEREARFPKDHGNIASVYWNRLYRPNSQTVSFLNADPTVQYARDSLNPPKSAASYWSPLQTAGRDTATDSPWNTYTKQGLPPTPICSPGLASMLAAANPPATDYYYFLAKANGESVFARTQQEQDANQQKYLGN
ncbi:MAG: endolytic transglycosylase MltG [Chloroflexi bacterium]|nr:MAG: endolytic transglycosylase MltG [Chloroflexota bacterium]